eukprot:403337114
MINHDLNLPDGTVIQDLADGRKIDLLFQFMPVVESIRQWIILLVSWFMIALFIFSAYRLYKTKRTLKSFDIIVLVVEAFKIFLFFLYEFAIKDLLGLLFVQLIQSSLRSVVLYYLVVLSANLIILILALVEGGKSINCTHDMFSYHWFAIDAVDFLQSILIMISAYIILKYMKESIREQAINFSTLSHEVKNMQCLKVQTQVLALSYLIFVICDVLILSLGNVLFDSGADFICADNSEVIASNNDGAIFLLFYSILILTFSLTLWFIYYKIPDHFGLVHKNNRQHLRIQSRDMFSQSQLIVDEIISINKDEDAYSTAPSNIKGSQSNSEYGSGEGVGYKSQLMGNSYTKTYGKQYKQSNTVIAKRNNKIIDKSNTTIFAYKNSATNNNELLNPNIQIDSQDNQTNSELDFDTLLEEDQNSKKNQSRNNPTHKDIFRNKTYNKQSLQL